MPDVNATEFVEMEHPDLEASAMIPATDVERRKSRGWKVKDEKSKKVLAERLQDEKAAAEAAKGGKA